MKRYVVIAPMGVTFFPGAVLADLSEAQQRRMGHAIRPVKGRKNQFTVVTAVMFKRGEEVSTADEVNKILLADLAPAESKLAKDTVAEAEASLAAARDKTEKAAADAADEAARRAAIEGTTAGAGATAEGEVVRGNAGSGSTEAPVS